MPNFLNSPINNGYTSSQNPNYNQDTNNIQGNNDEHQKTDSKSIRNNSEIKENRGIKGQITDEPFIEVFGIKLYFDDVLILSLLYFLYNENIKDEGLFLSLVLLLIT